MEHSVTGLHLLATLAGLVLLILLLHRRVLAERNVLMAVFGFFLLSSFAWGIGDVIAHDHPVASSTLTGFSIFALGLAYISMGGFLIFGVLCTWLGLHLPRIARDVTVGASHLVWMIIFLQWENVNLAGIIATTSVITAVIGLSMQDTLGNLISGLALQLDDSLHVGDWVKLNDLKGQVVETRWRFTAIETNNWETVVIPNSILMKNPFTVLGRRQGQPVQWRRWVYFNVDYRYPPTAVTEAVEKGVRLAKIPNVAEDPLPNCIQIDYDQSSARYAVRYWLTNILRDDPTDSEVRSHIYFALKRAGFNPAITAATVLLTEENEERAAAKLSQKLQSRLQALQKVDLFRDLPVEELEMVAGKLQVVPFAKGEIITRQGAVAHYIYLLISGTVDIMVENEAHQSAKVAAIEPGSVFGEYGAMTGQPRDATVVATSNVEVYRLDKEVFRTILQERPQLMEELGGVLAERRTHRQSALENLDAAAHSALLTENKNFIMKSLRKLFAPEG